MTTKRTLHGARKKAVKKSGFRARMATKSGSKILSNRRKKKRQQLAIS